MNHPVIGVTGMPCAGKSRAAEILASGEITGVPGTVVKADDLGHLVLKRPDVEALLRERFGDDIFTTNDPAAVRARVAQRVFGSPKDLAWLESMVHPRVIEEADAAILRNRAQGPVIIEAALLFVSNMDKNCDLVLVVEAEFNARLRRAATRSWTRLELERRDARLKPFFDRERIDGGDGKVVFVRNDDNDGLLAARIQDALAHSRFGESGNCF